MKGVLIKMNIALHNKLIRGVTIRCRHSGAQLAITLARFVTRPETRIRASIHARRKKNSSIGDDRERQKNIIKFDIY